MYRTPGYIDGRRVRVGNVANWGDVPSVLIPGTDEAYGIFEDFVSLEQLAVGGDSMGWDFWIQNAAVLSQGDVAGGEALITCGGAANDSGQITLGSLAGGGIFHLAPDKHLWFEAKVKHSNLGANQISIFIGLINPVNLAILGDGLVALPNDDMLGWVVRSTETDWSTVGDKASAEDLNPLGATYALDTEYHTYGFYVDGYTEVTVYYDRDEVAGGAIPSNTHIPATGLMPVIAIKAGSVQAETIQVDYVMCVQLR